MEYITRKLASDPGLTQTEAMVRLQKSPSFVPGTIITSVRRRNDHWVAELLEPKTAEFPPKDDGGDEESGSDTPPAEGKDSSPSPDAGPPSDEGPPAPDDGPPSPDGDSKGDNPKDKGSTDEAILHTLTQILHALQGGGAPEGMGGPDALGPGPSGIDGPPPPKGGPPAPGGGKAGPSKFPPKPMKPGETPPGGTPIGAPAFSSTREATPSVQPSVGTPVPTGAAGPVGLQAQGGTCPQCGYAEPCPIHQSAEQMGGLNQAVASYSGKASTITLTTDSGDLKQAVADARPIVENYGYKVKQAKYGENGQVHILASRR